MRWLFLFGVGLVWLCGTKCLQAGDIRVLVSNVANANQYNPDVGSGYVVLPAPHADLNVIWDAATKTFSGGFMTDSDVSGGGAAVQFGPEDALAYLPSTGQRQRTSSASQYDFQGAMGETYWIFPSGSTSSNNAFSLYLGFSAYGVPNDGTFTGSGASTTGRIRWTVHSVENLTTPAATAFYGYSVSGGSTVNMQLTLDPAYPNREMVILANGHSHLNLLFKAAGMYRVTFRVRGTLVATGEEVSSLVPVYFGVETWQIPATGSSFAGAYPGRSPTEMAPNQMSYLANYAFGGTATNSATPPVHHVSDPSKLGFKVVVRTNDLSLSVTGEVSTNPAGGWSSAGVTVAPDPNQANLPPNTVRRIISVDRGSDPRKFFRLAVRKVD